MAWLGREGKALDRENERWLARVRSLFHHDPWTCPAEGRVLAGRLLTLSHSKEVSGKVVGHELLN